MELEDLRATHATHITTLIETHTSETRTLVETHTSETNTLIETHTTGKVLRLNYRYLTILISFRITFVPSHTNGATASIRGWRSFESIGTATGGGGECRGSQRTRACEGER
jgi:hypothetical protein